MRSPDLTDDGLDERHQTSCVLDEADPQDIHELTQKIGLDKRWACDVEFGNIVAHTQVRELTCELRWLCYTRL